MYPHSVAHVAALVVLSLGLVASAGAMVLRRAQGEFVRRYAPLPLGLALMLASEALSGGTHGAAAGLLALAGSVAVAVGGVRLARWQRQNRQPSA